MAAFYIGFTGETDDDNPALAVGEIMIGDLRETFLADTTYWSTDQYTHHWHQALTMLLDGAEKGCLLTSITDPEHAIYFGCWLVYRDGDTVHLQQQLLFLEDLDDPIDLNSPWDSADDRETVDEDGQHISEWDIQIDDVEAFLADHSAESPTTDKLGAEDGQ